jgi:hypothetical protein
MTQENAMANFDRTAVIALTAILLFGLSSHPAQAQKKPTGASGKHQACVAKARAENPHPNDGRARQAAFNRCMGR